MEGQWNANEREVAEIKAIASSQSDSPVLMININKYNDSEYPNGETYRNYMKKGRTSYRPGRFPNHIYIYGKAAPCDRDLPVWLLFYTVSFCFRIVVLDLVLISLFEGVWESSKCRNSYCGLGSGGSPEQASQALPTRKPPREGSNHAKN